MIDWGLTPPETHHGVPALMPIKPQKLMALHFQQNLFLKLVALLPLLAHLEQVNLAF